MGKEDFENKYKPYKIPSREQFQKKKVSSELHNEKSGTQLSLFDGPFYEIEYDSPQNYEIDYHSSPFPGVGKFVMKPQKIVPPEKMRFVSCFMICGI